MQATQQVPVHTFAPSTLATGLVAVIAAIILVVALALGAASLGSSGTAGTDGAAAAAQKALIDFRRAEREERWAMPQPAGKSGTGGGHGPGSRFPN